MDTMTKMIQNGGPVTFAIVGGLFGLCTSLVVSKEIVSYLSLCGTIFGVLLWGRHLSPVTRDFGRVAAGLLLFAWTSSLIVVVRCSIAREMAHALIASISLGVVSIFGGRLAKLHYEESQWLRALKKSDDSVSRTPMKAFSSEDYAAMESSV